MINNIIMVNTILNISKAKILSIIKVRLNFLKLISFLQIMVTNFMLKIQLRHRTLNYRREIIPAVIFISPSTSPGM